MKKNAGFTLIELMIVVAIIAIIAAIAIPNLLQAVDRSKQKRSMADIRYLGTALEEYAIDNSFYPNVAAEAIVAGSAVVTSLQGDYARTIPSKDGWSFDLRYVSDTTVYTLGSLGKDALVGGNLTLSGGGGPTTNFDCDIIFSRGSFIQWPEGTQYD